MPSLRACFGEEVHDLEVQGVVTVADLVVHCGAESMSRTTI
jgi:hypothetical protein